MEECHCCNIIKGCGSGYQSKKYVVELEGGWVLNHFGLTDENETYLGRLVLGTKCHRVDWGDLSLKEATTLGLNIQRINHSLRQYWAKNYPEDPIELVHIAYLNEGPYSEKWSGEELLRRLHVHTHLLPRTKQMGEALDYCGKKIDWHLVDYVGKFPPKYKVSSLKDEGVKTLMQHLQVSLYKGEVSSATNQD